MVRIGTTDVSPETVAPTVNNIEVCASQDSPVGDGETHVFPCEGIGRYLVVILEQTVTLVFCELEVFQGKYAMHANDTD